MGDTVLERRQANMPTNGILIEHDGVENSLRLSLDIIVLRGQQALQAEAFALLLREPRAFVVQRVTQQ